MKVTKLLAATSKQQATVPTADAIQQTRLVNGCILASSLTEHSLSPSVDYAAIKSACRLNDHPDPEDIDRVAEWVIARRGHATLSASWQKVLRILETWFTRPLRTLPFLMVAVAAGFCIVTFALDWLLALRATAGLPDQSYMATYSIPVVLTGLANRLFLLVITTLLSMYGLVRAILPITRTTPNRDDADTVNLSALDHLTNWAITSLGRCSKLSREERLTANDDVADGTRKLLLGIVRPHEIMLSAVLLIVGAGFIGLNAGHYSAYLLIEGQNNESAPLWRGNIIGERQRLLSYWLALTETDPKSFTGDTGFTQLMEWLRQPLKEQGKPAFENKWRDSFSRLIGNSNRILTLLSAIPLTANLLAFLITAAKLRWSAIGLEQQLAQLPVGYKTCGDIVEEIRAWRPPQTGPTKVEPSTAPPPATTDRRLTDEVWLIPVHTLMDSADLLREEDVASLSTQLGRTVRVFDASTPVLRKAVLRTDKAAVPLGEQPACVVFIAHALASPTIDIRGFVRQLSQELSASVHLVLVADRHLVPSSESAARDGQWQTAFAVEGDSHTSQDSGQSVIITLRPRAGGEQEQNWLSREISRALSQSFVRETAPTDVVVAINDQRLAQAYAIVAAAVGHARMMSGHETFDTYEHTVRKHLVDAFSGKASAIDELIITHGQKARDLLHSAADIAQEVIQQRRREASGTIRAIETMAFRAATTLAALTASTFFLGFFPLTPFFASITAGAWAIYFIVRVLRSRIAPPATEVLVSDPSVALQAEQAHSFLQNLVSATCDLYYRDADDSGRGCRLEATKARNEAVLDQFPSEQDLRTYWERCFPQSKETERTTPCVR